MAKDDYFRIAYLILQYLYEELKSGSRYVSLQDIKIKAIDVDIPLSYFASIMDDLIGEGYLKPIVEPVQYLRRSLDHVTDVSITMKGVEYLVENTIMQRIAKLQR